MDTWILLKVRSMQIEIQYDHSKVQNRHRYAIGTTAIMAIFRIIFIDYVVAVVVVEIQYDYVSSEVPSRQIFSTQGLLP